MTDTEPGERNLLLCSKLNLVGIGVHEILCINSSFRSYGVLLSSETTFTVMDYAKISSHNG